MSIEEKGSVIVIDDEPHQRLILEQAVRDLGYEVTAFSRGEEVTKAVRFGSYDVVITDRHMPEMDGIQLLESIRLHDPTVSVILVTAHGTVETAVEAIKKGAEDYILKPIEFDHLELTLDKVFKKRDLVRENRRLQSENEQLKRDLKLKYHSANIIGRSPLLERVTKQITEYSQRKVPVLILGDPGTNRGDIARTIHYNSPWAEKEILYFECGSVPTELHELHLFGEEAKTVGGVRTPSRAGLLEKAHLGTLVLGDIHKLNPKCQPGISRCFKEEKSQRTGGTKFYPSNPRIMATSSHSEIELLLKSTDGRWDVHDALLQNKIEIPSIKDRKEDIPILIAATAKWIGESYGKEIKKVDPKVVTLLQDYDFPVNLRELTVLVEAAIIRCTGDTLKAEDFTLVRPSS